MVENGAFMDMKEGILEELKAKGYTEDNTTFDYQCASGDATTLSTIAGAVKGVLPALHADLVPIVDRGNTGECEQHQRREAQTLQTQ